MQMKTSSWTVSKARYSMSGRTQQLVCPYMVSGRSVAATRNTGLPATDLWIWRGREGRGREGGGRGEREGGEGGGEGEGREGGRGEREGGRGGKGERGGRGGWNTPRAIPYGIRLREFLWKRLHCSHLDERVLLRPHPLSTGPVVVHAGLAIFGREDSVSLPKLDLVLLLEVDELPPHKRVVERVGISGDEGATPIHLQVGGARDERGSCDQLLSLDHDHSH